MAKSPKADVSKPATGDGVKRWLSSEGFPFEMEVAATFLESEYSVAQAEYYVDETTQKAREIDVIARRGEWLSEDRVSVYVSCVAECKYSRDKPWVLLTPRRSTRCAIIGAESRRVASNEHGQILADNLDKAEFGGEPFLVGPPAAGYAAVTGAAVTPGTRRG